MPNSAVDNLLNPGGQNEGQVIMDLGDFIPEEYILNFSINGHKYSFKYEEVHVDEILRMLMFGDPTDEKEGEDSKDYINRNRSALYEFLQKYITEGDKAQLKTDLDKVPFRSNRGGMSIIRLLAEVNVRAKKKENGDGIVTRENSLQSGSPEALPS